MNNQPLKIPMSTEDIGIHLDKPVYLSIVRWKQIANNAINNCKWIQIIYVLIINRASYMRKSEVNRLT